MTERERLVELITEAHEYWLKYVDDCAFNQEPLAFTFEQMFADHLLSNGVIVPLCYIGQPIWYLHKSYDGLIELDEGKVSMIQQKADKSWKVRITINSSVWDFTPNEIGIRYFLSREDAEKALKERSEGK